MKKLMKPVLLLLSATILLSSCMGNFTLTKKLYKWNGRATGNKFVNNLIFWVLSEIYAVTLFIDSAILNLIQFWTGTNPMAFSPDFEGTDRLAYLGKIYELEKSSDKLTIRELEGEVVFAMVKAPDNTWHAINGDQQIPMFKEDGETVTFYQSGSAFEMKQAAVTDINPFSPATPVWAAR